MTKKLIALLLAVLMLVTLFSACAGNNKTDDTASDDTGTDDTANTDNTSDDTEDTADEPEETEPYTLTFLGCETNQWTFTWEEGVQKKFATYQAMEDYALDNYNFKLERTVADVSAYLTTLQGQLASDQLMDIVYTGFLAADALLSTVEQGKYANINDVLENSDQEVADYFKEDGCLNFIKAICADENGDWYWFRMVNGGGSELNLDHDDVDYLTDFSWNIHIMTIRYDWLEKVGLELPTNTDEVFQAIKSFQDNDCNGNGTADERIMLSLGDEENFYANGVASWYGLPTFPVGIDTTSGAVEVAYTSVGYLPYIQYVKQFYDNSLVYFTEGENYQSGVEIAGNYCSGHTMGPGNTSRTATEDPNATYGPLPIIQAIEGVEPTYIIQCIGWGDERLVSYSSKVDLAAAGRFMSYLHSEYFYMTLINGIEGVAWDWTDHDARTITTYTLSQDETYNYGGMFCFMPWAGWPQEMFFVKWGTAQDYYTSMSQYVESGKAYSIKGEIVSKEEYFEYYADKYNFVEYKGESYNGYELFIRFLMDFGENNMNWRAWTKFGAAPTKEESETIGQIGTDLLTYLAELSSAYVTGNKSMDNFEADIQYAYDSLNFQEYINIIQAQANRYLVAIGREAVPIAE